MALMTQLLLIQRVDFCETAAVYSEEVLSPRFRKFEDQVETELEVILGICLLFKSVERNFSFLLNTRSLNEIVI